MSKDNMTASSSTWHYRFEHHKVVYGSAILFVGLVLASLAGHDYDIMRGVEQGYYDINTTQDLYLKMSNLATLNGIWVIGIAMLLGGIAYMVLVALAHRRISKDRFPL